MGHGCVYVEPPFLSKNSIMKLTKLSICMATCLFGMCYCVREVRAMTKISGKEQVVEFRKLLKKIERFDGTHIIEGDRAAFTIIRTTTTLLIDNLRTQSGKRKAARLMLWSTLVH